MIWPSCNWHCIYIKDKFGACILVGGMKKQWWKLILDPMKDEVLVASMLDLDVIDIIQTTYISLWFLLLLVELFIFMWVVENMYISKVEPRTKKDNVLNVWGYMLW